MERETALQELPAPYAVALRLRDRGATDLEIAEVIGISPESMPAHLQIAEAKLARLLETDGQGEESR